MNKRPNLAKSIVPRENNLLFIPLQIMSTHNPHMK